MSKFTESVTIIYVHVKYLCQGFKLLRMYFSFVKGCSTIVVQNVNNWISLGKYLQETYLFLVSQANLLFTIILAYGQ